MKKVFVIAAAAAAVLAAGCAKNEVIQNQGPGDAVSFGVYVPKTVTKAVSATDFGAFNTATSLQGATNGFGVFAYYTDNADYTTGSYYANFMYNQKVTYNSSSWEYSPVKYWPNEHGTSASSSTRVDKLTFMAYAPWVDVKDLNNGVPSTVNDGSNNAATEGIINMSGNAVQEDATLSFVVPASSEEQIDLLYGVLNSQSVNVDDVNQGSINGPIANLTKQKTSGHVDILFKHALAKAQIDIKDIVDAVSGTTTVNPASDNTKVFVKSLNILGTGLGTSGKLNLYTGLWSNTAGTTSFSVRPLPTSIYQASAPANGTAYDAILENGVVETGLGASKLNLMFVPAGTISGIEIVYYVCTRDSNLATGISVVENHITSEFDTDGGLTGNQPITVGMGKQYNITIQLGLTSVKLQATVNDWDAVDYSIDLPQNVN